MPVMMMAACMRVAGVEDALVASLPDDGLEQRRRGAHRLLRQLLPQQRVVLVAPQPRIVVVTAAVCSVFQAADVSRYRAQLVDRAEARIVDRPPPACARRSRSSPPRFLPAAPAWSRSSGTGRPWTSPVSASTSEMVIRSVALVVHQPRRGVEDLAPPRRVLLGASPVAPTRVSSSVDRAGDEVGDAARPPARPPLRSARHWTARRDRRKKGPVSAEKRRGILSCGPVVPATFLRRYTKPTHAAPPRA